MDSSTKAKLDLWTAEVVDVLENAVDIGQDVKLGLIPTVSEMFHCQLVHVTGFPRLHLGGKDSIELSDGHKRYLGVLFSREVKDIVIIKFTEFVKTLITV